MKTIDKMILIAVAVNVIVNVFVYYQGRHDNHYNQPYSVTMQVVTQEDIETCRKDVNCMDIEGFDN